MTTFAYYETKTKSELWSIIKERQSDYPKHVGINAITWKSSKADMVTALVCHNADLMVTDEVEIVDSVPPTSEGTVSTDEPELNISKPDVITSAVSTTSVVNTTESQPTSDLDFSLWNEILLDTGINVTDTLSDTPTTPTLPTEKSEVPKTKLHEAIPQKVESRTQIFTWSYLDHEMAGSWKEVKDESEITRYVEFLEALNNYLEANRAKTFAVHNCKVSIKMKPRIIVEQDVNGRQLKRIDRSHQKNNLYANRNKTLMSTQEIAGRNIGEASVKASTLFQRSRYIAQPLQVDNAWNFEGIDTISVNGVQVYPVSIVAAIDESSVPDNQVPDKILKRREILAEKRVEARDFAHTRAKINNGLSPSFKDGNKLFCFQIDSNNRVSLWLLANDATHTVSASDLVKGRKLYDVGYVEVQPYTTKEFVNVTMDMIRGGSEARLERFDWIRKQLNKQYLDSDEAIYNYLSQLKNKDGEALVITNLQVNNGVVTGDLYGSKLIIRPREVTKHKVVFHPVGQSGHKAGKDIEAFKRVQACAQTWLFSISPNTLSDLRVEQAGIKHRDAVLGVQNVRRNTRVSPNMANNLAKYKARVAKDRKYIIKLLTQFTSTGIYADRNRTQYVGKLVKTDGSSLSEKQISDITEAVLHNYPIDQPIITLFTPSHAANVDEWKHMFLRLLKSYASVTVAILEDGKLVNYKSGNEVLEDYVNGLYYYLKGMGREVDTLTVGGAIELLENSPSSPYKQVLLRVPNVVKLNSHMSLAILAGKDKEALKQELQQQAIENLTVALAKAKLTKVAEDKAAKLSALTEHLR